ncbi:MAG: hypothetical protein GY856_13075 [bacterium]|nr:hypothetical protein [bacterium]
MDSEKEFNSPSDEIVDELLPSGFNWRRLVCAYPIPALTVAAVGGFVIGRKHGPRLLAAVSAHAEHEVTKNLNSLLGTEPAE